MFLSTSDNELLLPSYWQTVVAWNKPLRYYGAFQIVKESVFFWSPTETPTMMQCPTCLILQRCKERTGNPNDRDLASWLFKGREGVSDCRLWELLIVITPWILDILQLYTELKITPWSTRRLSVNAASHWNNYRLLGFPFWYWPVPPVHALSAPPPPKMSTPCPLRVTRLKLYWKKWFSRNDSCCY